MVRFLSLSRILVSSAGIFMAFWFYGSAEVNLAYLLLTLTTVVYMGLTGYVSHVIFAEEDARRLGWEITDRSFQYEVGFANLAFALAAVVVVAANLPHVAQLTVVLGYAFYLLQASLLHLKKYLTVRHETGYLIRSVLLPMALEVMMIGFALVGMGIV